MDPPKNCWPSECDVSFEQAKHELVIYPSATIPSHLGPKYLSFETRGIAHIVATTLLPRAVSHSTFTQRDTLLTYCVVSQIKFHLFSLPFGMLITRILESHFMCLGDFSPIFIKQCYNSRTFVSMGYSRNDSSWVLKNDLEDVAAKNLMKSKPSSSTSVSSAKLNAALANLADECKIGCYVYHFHSDKRPYDHDDCHGEQVDSLKDLLLSAHLKIDNMKDVTKETGADVARIRQGLIRLSKRLSRL
ncbi:hypothetical protein R3W88_029981 [Solanum pinnatisectum]|uniref:Uncharacterized protein n=1 Tax=Solanum pinnatisectum TaxID=50273 RepID=A0AAV9K7A9_9SOLN|nr:hypothetical protein R3W88_029981 [Solanum pinnatisectum]